SFALLNGAWPKDMSGCDVVLVGDEDGISKKVFGRYFKNVSNIEQADHLSENVIIAISTKVSAWRGLSGIDEETLKKINMLLKRAKRSAVVSFGSPYVLAGIKGAGALAAAYGYDEWIQEQFVHHIFEGAEFFGKLPVNIPIQEAQG
ncbi:MAG: hypothetical protein LLF86_05165, partial [Nitrospiraceae bacterium]|nr:hypothetical protein [Nitrospiraceae bacterium]